MKRIRTNCDVRVALVVAAGILFCSPVTMQAQDLNAITARPILDVHQTHRELQAFVRSRIAPLPKADNADRRLRRQPFESPFWKTLSTVVKRPHGGTVRCTFS